MFASRYFLTDTRYYEMISVSAIFTKYKMTSYITWWRQPNKNFPDRD